MVAAAQPTKPTPGVPDEEVVTPCLGVLFVHGAGDHGVGSTLIEFGEPVIAWLNGWLRNGQPSGQIANDRALTGASQILVREGDAGAPAHSLVCLRPRGGPTNGHTWLMAEARWDEAFTPPGFQEVLRWALGVVPWTILTQFIGPLARQARFVESDPWSIALFLIRVAVAAVGALIVSALVITLATLVVILSLIPIEAVRGFVGKLQRFASAGVGDLYIVLTSPIQRAALSSAVQRDIDWLRDQGCERIAVVAHSQGGYVAYQALTEPWPRTVSLFITFGSGLIRLSESERARRSSSLVLALIGTVGALIAIRFLPSALLGQAGIWEKHEADVLACGVGATVSMLLVVVLWRYFHDRRTIADLSPPIPWFDFLTTQDPVMNRRREGILPERVEQPRVQNRGSILSDHSAYWKNSDQFVPQVAREIGKLDPGLDLMVKGPKRTEAAANALIEAASERRRGRVAALRRRRIAVMLATAAVLAVMLVRGHLEEIGQPIYEFVSDLPPILTEWVPDIVFAILPVQGNERVILGGLVVVALIGLATLVGSQLWNRWSMRDTEREFRGRAAGKPSGPQVAFYVWSLFQILVLGGVALFGPGPIASQVLGIADKSDEIVQAWASAYIWTLVVGVVAFIWATSPDRASVSDAKFRVIGGVSLALSLELFVAIIVPGEMPILISLPLGIVVGIAAVALITLIWPFLQWVVERVATLVEDQEEKSQAQRVASVIDYLGFIGLLLALLAIGLAVVGYLGVKVDNINRLWFASGALALVAAALGLPLAVNEHGVPEPRTRPVHWLMAHFRVFRRSWRAAMRMTERGSSTTMRILGALTIVAGLAAFAAATYGAMRGPGA